MTTIPRAAPASPSQPTRPGGARLAALVLATALVMGGTPHPALAQGPGPGNGASAGAGTGGRFSVTDDLASQEVSENTEIYLDGKLLAHFALDRAHPNRQVTASVADGADRHAYALCGEITVRGPNGTTETHEVNSGGFISDVDGRSFQALGASDFTFFYLADPAPGRALTEPQPGRSPLCHPPVS